jgi:hypothetical protein
MRPAGGCLIAWHRVSGPGQGLEIPLKLGGIKPSPLRHPMKYGFAGFRSAQNTLSCSTMLLVGDDSPHLDDVTLMNSGLDPTRTTLFKVADCGGLALEEQPEKVRTINNKIIISDCILFLVWVYSIFDYKYAVHYTV